MIINTYKFGSHVYGTNDINSDEDYIYITTNIELDNTVDSNDYKYYTIDTFQKMLDSMNIQALECYFSDDMFKRETHKFTYTQNKELLRKFISTNSSNSYIKCKKKLMRNEDYNLRIGIKSFFHSLRMLDFGIQIAKNNKIIKWTRYNHILKDLYNMSELYEYDELWTKIKEKYKPLYNRLRTEFKKLT